MNDRVIQLLLIEDNAADARLIREMLADAEQSKDLPISSLNVEWVTRLTDGLERLAVMEYDVILLDLSLPDTFGLATLTRVHEQTPRTPIIVLTGLSDRALAIEAAKDGAHDYLIKDEVDSTLLVRAVYYAIERQRGREAMRRYAGRLEVLRAVDRAILTAQSPEEIGVAVLRHLRRLIPCRYASIAIFDVALEEAQLLTTYDQGEVKGRSSPSFPSMVLRREDLQLQETQVIAGPETHSLLHPMEQELVTRGMRVFVNVPLLVEDQLIGALKLADVDPNVFTPEHVAIAHEVADSLAVAIQQAHLREQIERHAGRLTTALERVRELDRFKGEIIQNVSHELRSPLTLMWGYADLLTAGELGELNPAQLHAADVVRRRAQSLAHLVEDITLLLAAETRTLNREPIHFGELVRTAVEDFRLAASQAGLRLESHIDSDLPLLLGAPLHLRRVVDNLLANGIKFTPAGGVITVRLQYREDMLFLQVADTGIGIPPEEHPRIFERFYQVDGSSRRRYGGVGLGLALVREIVEAYGGQITVESEVGKGSTFTVTFPSVSLQDVRQRTLEEESA